MVIFNVSKFVNDLQSEHTANVNLTNTNGKPTAEIVVDDCGEFYKIMYVKVVDGQNTLHVLDVQKSLWDTVNFIRGFFAAVNFL